jgi:hypothetical protein
LILLDWEDYSLIVYRNNECFFGDRFYSGVFTE